MTGNNKRDGSMSSWGSQARTTLVRPLAPLLCLLLMVPVIGVVAASGEGSAASEGPDLLHTTLEFIQLFGGIAAVAAAGVGLQAMRGGHMEQAFLLLTGGVVAFLAERIWHSIHEFGLVPLPDMASQLLFITSTVLIALGFGLTYQIMSPSR